MTLLSLTFSFSVSEALQSFGNENTDPHYCHCDIYFISVSVVNNLSGAAEDHNLRGVPNTRLQRQTYTPVC